MKKLAALIFHLFLLIFLTIVTCTGGVAHLAWILGEKKFKSPWVKMIAWPFLYAIVWLMTSFTGNFTGRSRLPICESIRPASWFYVITNRTFVLDHVKDDVEQMAQWMEEEDITLHYLDSAFPFDVPLIPHWSHQNGACIDFTFVYDKGPRGLVYGDFEEPLQNESNRPELCTTKNPLYSATKYLSPFSSDNPIDVPKTQKMISRFLNNAKVNKCFLELHLVERWGLKHQRMRFHGCHAVRHDDHLHVEWKY